MALNLPLPSKSQELKTMSPLESLEVNETVWPGALASVVAARSSAAIWRRLFNEDPPD